MYSMEESWDIENQETISPSQELKEKYQDRLEEVELMFHSPKYANNREFRLEQKKQKIRNWYEIKEQLIELTKEANSLECQNVERRQEIIIQLRKREKELKLLKTKLKLKTKPKPFVQMLKEPRSTLAQKKTEDRSVAEIDDLLAGFQAMRNYLQEKYGWQFPKQQEDCSVEESYDDMDVLRTDRIKFDLLENNIYHLDMNAQHLYEMERYKRKHKNGLLDQSVRSYQSLANSVKKEVLSLKFDKTTTRLPPIPKEHNVPQSNHQVSSFIKTIGYSKRSPYFSPSQMLSSSKKRSPQFGFLVEDIVANSVSSRVLTRKQTQNISEQESQRKGRKLQRLDGSISNSQERLIKLKHYHPDTNFDIIREVASKRKPEKRKDRAEAQKEMVDKVVQRSRTILHRLESKGKKPVEEHNFIKIKEAQKKFLTEANSLCKASKFQLEERLEDISELFFKIEKKQQPKLFDYYKKQFKK